MVELKFAWKKETPLQHPSKTDAQPLHSKAERKARHYKFLQKLDHIIKAEKQSGSLVNISINNEALKEIQHENNPFNEEKDRVQRVDPVKTKMILDLITEGYSMTETQRLARASATTIKHVMSDGAVKLRPIFKYQLKGTKENKLDFYTKNLRQIVNYTGIDFKKLKNENFLADRGYRLLHINKRWNQLPNGSIYSATDADNIYLKKGINSFENKELIIDKAKTLEDAKENAKDISCAMQHLIKELDLDESKVLTDAIIAAAISDSGIGKAFSSLFEEKK